MTRSNRLLTSSTSRPKKPPLWKTQYRAPKIDKYSSSIATISWRARASASRTDLRTNKHFTLKENALKRADLDDFVACYNPKNRHERKESERFKSFTYEELTKGDKLNFGIFWLKDEPLEDSANLPDPDIIAAEIVEDLQAALAQFAEIAADLKR